MISEGVILCAIRIVMSLSSKIYRDGVANWEKLHNRANGEALHT